MLGRARRPPLDDAASRQGAAGDPSSSNDPPSRPRLSLCISTYNRAAWLAKNLENWSQLYPKPVAGVEILVCDNASTDRTAKVAARYCRRADFSYRRNPVNVGMLGNLRETTMAAKGDYIWIIGDDDLIVPGAVERVLRAIVENPGVSLIYLNYAFTRIDDARRVRHFAAFFREATPIVPPQPDCLGPIKTFCARNENFFTAIYTLVFRRDHAIGAYSQDTSGRPFSTMLTCIPTTHYVLNRMMDEPGVWIGEPQIVVNMNVSWMRYAPLWILERIPEVYDVAEDKGVPTEEINRWRRHTLPGFNHYFTEIFQRDPEGNAEFLSAARAIRRFAKLPEFEDYRQNLRAVYDQAHRAGHAAAKEPVESVFSVEPR
jgi:hypothetical protein